MRDNEALRVGVVVVIAAALLFAISLSLRRAARHAETHVLAVSVQDARGINRDAEVRLHGVVVGRVTEVQLGEDGQPLLLLRVAQEVRPDSNDRIRIAVPAIGFAPPWVEITHRPGGEPVTGDPPLYTGVTDPELMELVPQAQVLLENLNELSARLAGLTGSFEELASDPELRRGILASARNLERMSANMESVSGNLMVASGRVVEASEEVPAFMAELQGIAQNARQASGQFEQSLGHLREAAEHGVRAIEQAEGVIGEFRGFGAEAQGLVTDTRGLVTDSRGLVGDARGLMTDSRDGMRELMTGLRGSLAQLDETLAETRGLVSDPALRANLEQTTVNLRDATEVARKIAEDLRGITGDPEVQTDLRAAVASLRVTSDEAQGAFRRLNDFLTRSEEVARSAREGIQRLGHAEMRAELLRGFGPGQTRLDLNFHVPWSDNEFLRLGLYDATEANRFNLQYGQPVRRNLALRYGLYASRLGLGLDVGHPNSFASVELYSIDRPTLDVRGYVPLSDRMDLSFGLDSVFGRNQAILGIRYR